MFPATNTRCDGTGNDVTGGAPTAGFLSFKRSGENLLWNAFLLRCNATFLALAIAPASPSAASTEVFLHSSQIHRRGLQTKLAEKQ